MINSIEDYLDQVEEYKGNCYFRGQANISWDISPSIFRDSVYLASENVNIGETYSNSEHKRIFNKMLKMQHYGQLTRLCDLSVNPLVALFFALDGDKELDKNGCVYILDCMNRVPFDSPEIKIMTKVATSDLANTYQIRDEITKDFNLDLTVDEIKAIIFQNVIVTYGYELAFSNPRVHLQGGTVIFFGFSTSDGVNIERSNNYGVSDIIKKLIIPSNKKLYFSNELQKRGITSELLYDRIFEYRMTSTNSIKYSVEIDRVDQMTGFKKVILWIKIADIRYSYDDIFEMVNEVFKKMKHKYGVKSKIWMYVYYDIDDKRAYNFICYVDPNNNYSDFTIKWKDDYHAKRMEYSNHQISSQEILARLEPIVKEFESCWESIKEKHAHLSDGLIDREKYRSFLKSLKNKLSPLCYWDSQDIAHGGDKIYDFQEISHELIDNIMFLVEDQLMYIDREVNDYLLHHMYNSRNNDCEKSHMQYREKFGLLSI